MNLESLLRTPPWEWPESAASILLAVLENRGAPEADRVDAAELAGDIVVIDDELVDALLRIVGDSAESEELRGGAAIALGPVLELADTEGFDEADPFADVPITAASFHRIQRELRAHFRDASVPTEVRRRVLEASVRAPEDWHADAVRAAYHSSDELWRLTAVFCMNHIAGFEAEILDALENAASSDIRFEAVRAAGEWGVKPAWRHLVRLIRERPPDRPLLIAAVGAAVSIRPRSAAAILDEVSDVDDEEIHAAIEEALAMAETDWADD
jgi:hypothetical protein